MPSKHVVSIGGETVKSYVEHVAGEHGIPGWVLWGVYGKETSFGTNVTTSSAGAKGAYQFIESTAKTYGYPYTNDVKDFTPQTETAAHYLSDLFHQYGNWDTALRKYSGGGYGEAEVKAAAAGAGPKRPPEENSFLGRAGSAPAKVGKAVEDVVKAPVAVGEWIAKEGPLNLLFSGVLLLAGAVIVIYGILVAVRPHERALSIPRPPVLV